MLALGQRVSKEAHPPVIVDVSDRVDELLRLGGLPVILSQFTGQVSQNRQMLFCCLRQTAHKLPTGWLCN
jgi:hypothetical protein